MSMNKKNYTFTNASQIGTNQTKAKILISLLEKHTPTIRRKKKIEKGRSEMLIWKQGD